MSNTVMVKPIRPYLDDVKGWQEPGGPAYSVSPSRASELKANGLVRDDDGVAPEVKVAPLVENKMAAAPANKAVETIFKK